MLERRVYHVVHRQDVWMVLREGFKRPHVVRESRDEAIRLAKRLAKCASNAAVVIHKPDDQVEREVSYCISGDDRSLS